MLPESQFISLDAHEERKKLKNQVTRPGFTRQTRKLNSLSRTDEHLQFPVQTCRHSIPERSLESKWKGRWQPRRPVDCPAVGRVLVMYSCNLQLLGNNANRRLYHRTDAQRLANQTE